MPAFSKREAIRSGWGMFRSHWQFLTAVTLTALTIEYLPNILSTVAGDRIGGGTLRLAVIVSLVSWLAATVVSMGMIRVALRLIDGESARFSDLFAEYRRFLPYVAATIVSGFLILVGLLLFVIPGIVAIIRLQFAGYLVIDKGMGPIAAVRESWSMTRGSTVNLLIFSILLSLISALGVAALVIGILVTIPVTLLSRVWVFRKLTRA